VAKAAPPVRATRAMQERARAPVAAARVTLAVRAPAVEAAHPAPAESEAAPPEQPAPAAPAGRRPLAARLAVRQAVPAWVAAARDRAAQAARRASWPRAATQRPHACSPAPVAQTAHLAVTARNARTACVAVVWRRVTPAAARFLAAVAMARARTESARRLAARRTSATVVRRAHSVAPEWSARRASACSRNPRASRTEAYAMRRILVVRGNRAVTACADRCAERRALTAMPTTPAAGAREEPARTENASSRRAGPRDKAARQVGCLAAIATRASRLASVCLQARSDLVSPATTAMAAPASPCSHATGVTAARSVAA
jgi:hypothetical protein